MSGKKTSIKLPPPRPENHKSRNHAPWVLITIFALVAGTGTGVWLGINAGKSESEEPVADPPVIVTTSEANSAEIEKRVIEARIAISEGNWSKAGELYASILKLDPENPEAKISLPLVKKHLQEANGTLVVTSEPAGAKVVIPGRPPVVTPAEFKDVPAGVTEIRIEKTGFEPIVTKVDVLEKQVTLLPKISLQKSLGSLELVSKPEGANFKIIRADGSELVKIGKTPETVQALDVGSYEVRISVDGWPDYVERVRVDHNRRTAVSAVFDRGGVNIVSRPPGAEVWAKPATSSRMEKMGVTPLTLKELPPGKHQVEIRYRDWAPIRRTVDVKGSITQNLEFAWETSVVKFTSNPPGAAVFHNNRRIGRGLSVTPFNLEMPEGDYSFEARYNGLSSVSKNLYIDGPGSTVVEFEFDYGSVSIESNPPGAAVIANGVPIGRTPLFKEVVPPGQYSYQITKENHKSTTLSGTVEPGGKLSFSTKLVSDFKPAVNRNFTNGLGQKMIWFGALNGWVAETETTQAQYKKITNQNPSDFKGDNLPVDSVNWFDASRFCNGLTVIEGGLGNLPAGYQYRLPTDSEWSEFAGETSLTNAVTSAFTRQLSTKPVGSVAPNNYGLFDIRGNVTEWVLDWYSQQIVNRARSEGAIVREEWIGTDRKVLRGGSWLRSTQVDLEIVYRRGAPPNQKDANDVGFRVVLMPK